MGLTPQLSSVDWHHHLTAFFRRLTMSQPTPSCVPGLFTGTEYRVPTPAWHEMLRDDARSCKLVRIEFCKTKSDKLHEFLILHFSHPTHTVARAVVIVDRAAKDRCQSSAIVSPSVASHGAVAALDRVHVVAQGDNLGTYLSNTYGPHDKLCILKYPSNPSSITHPPPSAMQISTLLLVVSKHQPNYNLYEYNCYWYADTIFEACKALFPAHQEECVKHEERGRCRLNLTVFNPRTLSDIYGEYDVEWKNIMQRQSLGQEIVARQDLQRMLDDQRRTYEAEQQRLRQEVEDLGRCNQELEARLRAVDQTPLQVGTVGN